MLEKQIVADPGLQPGRKGVGVGLGGYHWTHTADWAKVPSVFSLIALMIFRLLAESGNNFTLQCSATNCCKDVWWGVQTNACRAKRQQGIINVGLMSHLSRDHVITPSAEETDGRLRPISDDSRHPLLLLPLSRNSRRWAICFSMFICSIFLTPREDLRYLLEYSQKRNEISEGGKSSRESLFFMRV